MEEKNNKKSKKKYIIDIIIILMIIILKIYPIYAETTVFDYSITNILLIFILSTIWFLINLILRKKRVTLEKIILVVNAIVLLGSCSTIIAYKTTGIDVKKIIFNTYEFNEDIDNDGKEENIKIKEKNKEYSFIHNANILTDGPTSHTESICTIYIDDKKVDQLEIRNLRNIEIKDLKNKKVLEVVTEYSKFITSYYEVKKYEYMNNKFELISTVTEIPRILYIWKDRLEGKITGTQIKWQLINELTQSLKSGEWVNECGTKYLPTIVVKQENTRNIIKLEENNLEKYIEELNNMNELIIIPKRSYNISIELNIDNNNDSNVIILIVKKGEEILEEDLLLISE